MHQLSTTDERAAIYPELVEAGYWIIEAARCLNSMLHSVKHAQKASHSYIFFATSVITYKVLNRSRK